MIIEKPKELSKEVIDYDINFINGSAISITADPLTGDTYTVNPEQGLILFHLGQRLSYMDPENPIPAEEVIIPIRNVLCIRQRSRLVEPESFGAAADWQKMLEELVNPDQEPITH